MKGLRKYLAPFAPDQSGASAVLSDLGGIIVICDAGGCAGNICGFDEPRWFMKKSAIFSAGLRDMDAILGRDDRLVEKLADEPVDLLEINVSCPNVKEGGIAFGQNPHALEAITKEVKKEYPAEKTLDMIQKVWEMAGLMVDEKR